MEWLERLVPPGSIAGGLAVLSIAVVLGLAFGRLRFRGIGLGISGVLFAGIALGAVGLKIREDVLAFLMDFALILFVYALGLQVGPGFVASLKSEGLRWNLVGLIVTTGGATLAAMIVWLGLVNRPAASGLYAGAFASTPALAAGQNTLRERLLRESPQPANINDTIRSPALAYAVTYPFGTVGPILAIILLRRMFRVNIAAERRELLQAATRRRPRMGHIDVRITEKELLGKKLGEYPHFRREGVTLARLLRDGKHSVPTGETVFTENDVFRAVGPRPALARLLRRVGRRSRIDIARLGGPIDGIEMVATQRACLGRSLRELNLPNRFGVEIVRVTRNAIEMPPDANVPLKFGDVLTAIGPDRGLALAAAEVGNSSDVINRPQLMPLFVGILLGVIVGVIPIPIPGIEGGVRLGLAGGPLLVAILLSRLGNIGAFAWYMPVAATNLLRDFGLAVFLACVGLESGGDFVHTVTSLAGLRFVAWGAAITFIPMFITAVCLRAIWKMNFVELCGVISGSMTNSSTLAFSNDVTKSEAPAVGYAAIYPLGELVPIVGAQLLVTVFM
jgi:putative transport protein